MWLYLIPMSWLYWLKEKILLPNDSPVYRSNVKRDIDVKPWRVARVQRLPFDPQERQARDIEPSRKWCLAMDQRRPLEGDDWMRRYYRLLSRLSKTPATACSCSHIKSYSTLSYIYLHNI